MHFNVIVQSKNRAIIIIQRVQIQYQTIGSKVRFRNFKKKKKYERRQKIVSFLENTIHLRPPARKTATLEAPTKVTRLNKTHPRCLRQASLQPPKIHLYNDPYVGRAGIKNHSSSHTVSKPHRGANCGGVHPRHLTLMRL